MDKSDLRVPWRELRPETRAVLKQLKQVLQDEPRAKHAQITIDNLRGEGVPVVDIIRDYPSPTDGLVP